MTFKEIVGKTMDEIASIDKNQSQCSYCGVFRRLCLNNKSRELGITKLFMGHNLDDMSQSILMNFTNGDIEKLARLGPHEKIQQGLVPRMFPLRVIPEKENTLYAILKNIEYHDGECPYSLNAYRRLFRDIINDLEYKNPGTRHSILKSYNELKDILLKKYHPMDLYNCKICGEPTSQEICKSCIFKKKINYNLH